MDQTVSKEKKKKEEEVHTHTHTYLFISPSFTRGLEIVPVMQLCQALKLIGHKQRVNHLIKLSFLFGFHCSQKQWGITNTKFWMNVNSGIGNIVAAKIWKCSSS